MYALRKYSGGICRYIQNAGKHQTSVPLPRAAPLRAASPPPLPQTMEPDILQARVHELTRPHPRVDKMEYIQLADGRNMPALLVGTALLDQHLAPYIIMAAIDMGYRGIDTAWVYGNEKIVGEAIRKKIEDGTVKREDLFIVNKLWSTFHREDLVLEACQRSLDNMGLDYFDLYLLHNPMSFKEGLDPIPKVAGVIQYSTNDYLTAWRGLEQLPASGLARGLGLSNCAARQLRRALQGAAVEPLVNMVECHPYLNQQRLHDFCAERNVTLVAYGALGSRGTPAALRGDAAPVIGDPLVQVMAAGLGVTPAQLLISYQIHSGHPVAVKASTAAHLWDNLEALKLKLTDAQMDALNALNKNKRMFQFKGMGDTHKNYPFNDPF